MTDRDRREFLKQAGLGLAAAASSQAGSANAAAGQKIVMGAIGCGGQGRGLARTFASRPDVRLAYVCDPDAKRAAQAAAEVEKICGKAPKPIADLREVLDDPAIEAVTVATPDHWHGPATILACDAGKHVYVEKPAAHNVREGRLMIEAARRKDRVVQVGTQSRSTAHVRQAIDLVRDGAIGKVLVAKAWNTQRRRDIGHAATSEAPGGFDYDLWIGPAPAVPFQPNRHHYTWHWWYDFGTGDMGNDGVHELDVARWGLGVETHPSQVCAAGGKLFFDDDQQFPDTQYVLFDFPGDGAFGSARQLVYEQRLWTPYRQEGHENGVAFYGTEGVLFVGKNDGFRLFGPRNKLRDQAEGRADGAAHAANFLDCVRSGKRPNADIEIGHLSSSLCHFGNIATRKGVLSIDAENERIVGNDQAASLIGRRYRDHWAVPKGV